MGTLSLSSALNSNRIVFAVCCCVVMKTMRTVNERDAGYLRQPQQAACSAKPLTQQDVDFLSRMDGDTDARRKTKFINDLKQHPYFDPKMLEPKKAPFKEVSLTAGPVVKTHKASKTGL